MSMVVEIHEHKWCYPCEASIEGSTFRMEWCLLCGTIRINFQMGWSYMRPDGFREKVEAGAVIEKDTFVGKVPDRVYDKLTSKPGRSVLGRGLKELLDREIKPTALASIFGPRKGGT